MHCAYISVIATVAELDTVPSITYRIIYGGLTLKNKLRKHCLRNKVALFSTLGFIGIFFSSTLCDGLFIDWILLP